MYHGQRMSEQKNPGIREIFSSHDKTTVKNIEYEMLCGKKPFEVFLTHQQTAVNPFPTSDARENPDTLAHPTWNLLEARYQATLAPYEFHLPESDKTDFPKDPNEGYKLHLNVPIACVQAVSEYLKTEGYNHKYLSGCDDPGSLFTLYIGSHRLAFALAKRISTDLSKYLAKPTRTDEVEFAPNVVGRFSTRRHGYNKYGLGLRGISCLNRFSNSFWISDETRLKEYLKTAFNVTYESLSNNYGEYFHGSREA